MRSAILLSAMIIGDAILPNQPMSQGFIANAIYVILLTYFVFDIIEFSDKLTKDK